MRIAWTTNGGGAFETASNWSSDTVPSSLDTVTLPDLSGGAYTVTANGPVGDTILSLSIAAGNTLYIDGYYDNSYFGNPFTILAGTGTGANAGTITVYYDYLYIGGTFENNGVINLTENSVLWNNEQNLSFTGNGVINCGYTCQMYAYNLSNSNTINLTSSQMSISNQFINQKSGVIDSVSGESTGPSTLFLANTQNYNYGLLEATDGGTLNISGSDGPLNNTGGVIEANGSGSEVAIATPVIGGTLSTVNYGVITFIGELGGSVANEGTITLSSGDLLEFTLRV